MEVILRLAIGYRSNKILEVSLRPWFLASTLPSLAILEINAAGKGLTPVLFFLGCAGRCTMIFSSRLCSKSSDSTRCCRFSREARLMEKASSNLISLALRAEHLRFRETWHRTFSIFKNLRLHEEHAHFIISLRGFFLSRENISAQDIIFYRSSLTLQA